MDHRYHIVGAEDNFREFKEGVRHTRHAWVDRVWTYYLRAQDYANAFCNCLVCSRVIQKYYGHDKDLGYVKQVSRASVDAYKEVVFKIITDEDMSDQDVEAKLQAITKSEPMSRSRAYMRVMMALECINHTSDPHFLDQDLDLRVEWES